MSEAERAAEEAEYRDLIQSMREEGIFLAAEEVEHYDAARTVRLRDGSMSVSDGPAVNADLFLTGYFLIEVESFDTAINRAARHSRLNVRRASPLSQSSSDNGRSSERQPVKGRASGPSVSSAYAARAVAGFESRVTGVGMPVAVAASELPASSRKGG